MRKTVTITLKSDRVAPIGEEVITLPAGTILTGDLALERSDGPMGSREFQEPSFLSVSFEFDFAGRCLRYNGLLGFYHLWAPNGTQVAFQDATFVSECGTIDGMMDDREDWFYIRPDGVRHTNRLKYTDCHFELMVKTGAVHVRCCYYDQNPDITDYVTIYYARDLDDLVLMKDIKFSYYANGKVEDWRWGEGPYVTLVEVRAAPNGGG